MPFEGEGEWHFGGAVGAGITQTLRELGQNQGRVQDKNVVIFRVVFIRGWKRGDFKGDFSV